MREITPLVILFATPTLPMVNFFSDVGPSPDSTCINIGDEKVLFSPSTVTFKNNLSSIFAPILKPFMILFGGLVISFSPSI